MLLYIGLGLVLLARVNIEPAWEPSSGSFPLALAGVSPLNASLTSYWTSSDFWNEWQSSLTDPTAVISIPPHSCSGNYCLSYFMPGGLNIPSNNSPASPSATSVIIYDTPGYQLEFYPMNATDPTFDNTTDCIVYEGGNYELSVLICLKAVRNSFLTGNNFQIAANEYRL